MDGTPGVVCADARDVRFLAHGRCSGRDAGQDWQGAGASSQKERPPRRANQHFIYRQTPGDPLRRTARGFVAAGDML